MAHTDMDTLICRYTFPDFEEHSYTDRSRMDIAFELQHAHRLCTCNILQGQKRRSHLWSGTGVVSTTGSSKMYLAGRSEMASRYI